MKLKSVLTGAASLTLLVACHTMPTEKTTETLVVEEVVEIDLSAQQAAETAAAEAAVAAETMKAERLAAALDAQSDEAKARYDARHPAETLTFFGIEPGMTVVEALPGGGWYTKILLPYLGPDGTVIGAHYPDAMFPLMLAGAPEERIASIIEGNNNWQSGAEDWRDETSAKLGPQYKMTELPEDAAGKADAILFIRALHNLVRTEDELGTFTATVAEAYRVLKPGGVVGVVQHRAAEDTPDEWADGNAGYLKTSYVVKAFEDAGFVLEESSEINANPLDTAGPGDKVWRLPPTLGGTKENTPERAAVEAIGESDRMTLRFRKPA